MRPGFYQPGRVIPVLGVRALANESDAQRGLLKMEHLHKSILHGGDGILSNPSLFFIDVFDVGGRRKPLMFQIGQSNPEDSNPLIDNPVNKPWIRS